MGAVVFSTASFEKPSIYRYWLTPSSIAKIESTQSTITAYTVKYFKVTGANLDAQNVDAQDGKVVLKNLAPNKSYIITVRGVAMNHEISGEMLVNTDNIQQGITLLSATNTSLKVRGYWYAGDAKIIGADFGSYGTGEDKEFDHYPYKELTLTKLKPGTSYYIPFYVTAEDGSRIMQGENFSTKPVDMKVSSMPYVTSCILKGSYINIDATILGSGWNDIENDNVEIYGLTPNCKYNIYEYFVTTKEGGRQTMPITFYTKVLTLETQPAQATSNTKALISAKTNGEDDALRFGFEWRRYDAPDIMPSNVVNCPVYDGVIAGTLNGLSPNTYYKFRPFYKPDYGNMVFYGDWVAFITADAYVYFEPVVHTTGVQGVSENSAMLTGTVMPGSDDVTEQGFEYWIERGSGAPHRATQNVQRVQVQVSSTLMTATLTGLQAGTTYYYRTYVQTAKSTTYGEERSFQTSGTTSIETINGIEQQSVSIVARYDLNGHRIELPQRGINILRMSDGTVKKVFVK